MKNSSQSVHIDNNFIGNNLENYNLPKVDLHPSDVLNGDKMEDKVDDEADLRNGGSTDVEGSQKSKNNKQKDDEKLNETIEKSNEESILPKDGDDNGSTYHSCIDMKHEYLQNSTKSLFDKKLDPNSLFDKRIDHSSCNASKINTSESNHSLFSNINVSFSKNQLFDTRSTSFNLTNSSNQLNKTSLFPNIDTTRPRNLSNVSSTSDNNHNHNHVHVLDNSNNTKKTSKTSLFSNNLTNIDNHEESKIRDNLPVVHGKGVFYIANSPSPPHDSKLLVPSSNLTNSSLLSPITQIKRQDSLFSNYQLINKDDKQDDYEEDYDDDDFTDSDVDEDEEIDDDDVDDVDDNEQVVRVVEEEEYDYTSTDISEDDEDFYSSEDEKIQLKDQPIEQPRSKAKSKALDDDSEWSSVTSEDDERLDIKISDTFPLQFKKIQPRAHTDTTVLSHSTPVPMQRHQKRNSTPTLQKPRSLLSGLFLNELPNKKNITPAMSKPILKTSTQTGIITVEQSRINPATTTQIKRPSILFSKKFNSFSDISKNYPHYHNNLVKDNILNDIPNHDDADILGKQRSMVGLSQYNVITKNATNRLSDSTKSLGETIVFTSSSYNETLSSSLNKFSDVVSHTSNMSNTSFKNLLSKSSLNLSKMYNTSISRFNKSDTSFSEKSSGSTIANGILHHSKTTSLDQTNRLATGNPKTNNIHHAILQDIKHDALTQPHQLDHHIAQLEISPKLLSPHSLSSPIATSLGSKKSNHSEVNNPKFTLSPKTTRRAMLSTELSESLKESIIIDYKLGKIPLPAKVINDRNIIGSQLVVDDDDNGYDDYHSKGW